jgi:two-component system cell cycle response regulator DivK
MKVLSFASWKECWREHELNEQAIDRRKARMMKQILIVEDVELNLDLLVQLLEDDYELITAENGKDGVSLARQRKPDLILMDLSLPILDGWEATRQIKAEDELKNIPIIGLSAHAMSGDKERALAAGCDDYLTKPLNDELLFQKLDHFLADN